MSGQQKLEKRIREMGFTLENRAKHRAIIDPATGKTVTVISRNQKSETGRDEANTIATLRRYLRATAP